MTQQCLNCRYVDRPTGSEPCRSCRYLNEWKPQADGEADANRFERTLAGLMTEELEVLKEAIEQGQHMALAFIEIELRSRRKIS